MSTQHRSFLPLVLVLLAAAMVPADVARADDRTIGLNQCLDHDHGWSENDHYRWTSSASGTVLVWFENSIFTSGSAYGQTNAGTTLCSTGYIPTFQSRQCSFDAAEGEAYQAYYDVASGSTTTHTTCVYGVTIASPSASATVTDTTPTLSGAAPSGAVVTVHEGATVLCSATANGSNAWSCTPSVALSEGSHTVTATAPYRGVDLTATRTFAVDSFTSVSITSPIEGQSFLAVAPSTATGTIEAGASLVLALDGAQVCTRSDGSGSWSCALPAMADGVHTLVATATDAAGNTASDTHGFTVRTVTPLTLTSPLNQTYTATPTYSGTAYPGAQISVSVDGVLRCNTTADGGGAWSCSGAALAHGAHTAQVISVEGGMQATVSRDFALDLETQVAVTGPTGQTGATPTITGTGEPGATIAISLNGAPTGNSSTVAGNGTWSWPVAMSLSDGAYVIDVLATDVYGHTATAMGAFEVNTSSYVDIVTPANGATLASMPTITGSAEPGATVVVELDGVVVCPDIVVPGSGAFTCDPGPVAADGAHTVTATADDGATPATESVSFTLDRATTVAITAPTAGSIVTASTPTISGTGEPFASIAIVIDGATAGSTTVAADGVWSIALGTAEALGDGPHSAEVEATDALGNEATASVAFTVNTATHVAILGPSDGAALAGIPAITGTVEAGVTVTVTVDGAAACVDSTTGDGTFGCTPASLADGTHTVVATADDGTFVATDTIVITLDRATTVGLTAPIGRVTTATPTVTGTGEPGATIAVSLDGAASGNTTVTAGGTFSYVVPTALAAGGHTVSVTATDTLGNTASDNDSFTVDLDTTIVIATPADGELRNTLPTVTGTAEAGASVTVFVDGAELCAVTAHAVTGAFSCPVVGVTGDGPHEVEARGSDGAFEATDTATFTLDTLTSVTITGPSGAIGDSTPTVTGTGEVGASVLIRVDTVEVGTVVVAADGHYGLALATPLADGPHDVTAFATDGAGNTASAAGSFTVDTSLPILSITHPVDESLVSDDTPEIRGVADPGMMVSLAIDGGAIVSVTANGLGLFTYTPPAPLTEGPHTVVAQASDGVGNVATAQADFTVDVTAPSIALLLPAPGEVTADPRPGVVGTTDPGLAVVVRVDGITVEALVATGTGDFGTAPASDLADGMHTATATATDAAGNTATASRDFVVDTTTSVAITSPVDDASIGAPAPSLGGTGEPGATVAISIDGVALGDTVVDAGGAWSFVVPAPLADGPHDVVALATDAVGNEATDESSFTIDPALRDSDGDGLMDDEEHDDGEERDTDGDGDPDHLDPDDDGDGIPTAEERPGDLDADTDDDGAPDHHDPDDDGDGVPTRDEAPEGESVDTDLDETPDHHDPDDDGDGIPTADERPDGADLDTDGDGAPDHQDPDDDGDGLPTAIERTDGDTHGHDVDGDGAPNHLDRDSDDDTLEDGAEGREDANADGVPNYLDPSLRMAGGARCATAAPGAGSGGGGLAALFLVFAFVARSRRRRASTRSPRAPAAARTTRAPAARVVSVAAIALAPLAASTAASAQSVAVETYRPAESSRDGFAVRLPGVPGHLRVGAQLHLDYANDPLVLEAGQGDATVERASIVGGLLAGHLVVSLGLLDRLLVFVGSPVYLAMTGDDASRLGPYPAADGGGAGDPFLGGRVRLFGDPGERVQLGAQLRFGLPVARWASDSNHYSGDGSVSADLAFLLGVDLGRVRLALNVGALLRSQQDFPAQTTGSRLAYGGGVYVPFLDDALVASVELFGAVGLADFGAREESPAEALAGAKYHHESGITAGASFGPGLSRGIGAPDFRVVAALGYSQPVPPPPPPNPDVDGDGIPNEADACANEAEDRDRFEDEDGCPDLDNDADGVPDSSDRAPNVPEDADGFDDLDGIPEADNDGDGFLDDADACPTRAEDVDHIADDDGCPEDDFDEDRVPDTMDRCPLVPGTLNPASPECIGCPELACLRDDGTIEIHDRVEFEFGTDRILASSEPVLRAVRDLIHATPTIRAVRIEGHTDDVGRDAINMRLSRDRAAAVRRWLIDNGVDAVRVVAFGCGEAVARRSNRTEEGRQENRRVEFHVTDPAPPGGARDSDVCEAVVE